MLLNQSQEYILQVAAGMRAVEVHVARLVLFQVIMLVRDEVAQVASVEAGDQQVQSLLAGLLR